MLGSLGIRQKLAVLLAIPLAAVVLVTVPYLLERADDARAAAATARTAAAARDIGSLIQALQQERLLALGYLSVPNLDRSALFAQTQTAIDDTMRLSRDPLTTAVIEKAAYELNALTVVRRGVVTRSTPPLTVYSAFRDVNTALLDGLGLIRPDGVDAPGLTQLSALEALMRSNEEVSSVGAMLVVAAADPTVSTTLITEAQTAGRHFMSRFRQLVSPQQMSLVDSVETGQAGQRINQLTLIVTAAPKYGTAEVSDALTAAVTYAGLRRLAQDRIAGDIAATAETRAADAQTLVRVFAGSGVVLLVVVVWLGITVGRSIARPLRRLTRAAAAVAELSRAELVRVADSDTPQAGPPQLAAVEVDSIDEIGELATVVNRVQATAALLLERQVTTRANVSTMFANIARRTQNLVGRQLNLIDELARMESDAATLARIERLDHVAIRLRRSADSLLVVSGTIDQVMSGNPSHLADVIEVARAEIEGFEAVAVGAVANVGVNANLVGDLRLLLAELLENATNFSPPGSPVMVSAVMGAECLISIVDRGVGMSPSKLQEENRRLVDRERLDVAPTTVLGLFVVGRLARRHGLSVHLGHSPGSGVTATVRIPVRLLTSLTRTVAIPSQRRPRRAPAVLSATPAVSVGPGLGAALAAVSRLAEDVAAMGPGDAFGWFADEPTTPPAARHQRRPEPLDPVTGLARRVPGTHIVDNILRSPQAPSGRGARDPEAERDALNDYLAGLKRGSGSAGPNRAERPL